MIEGVDQVDLGSDSESERGRTAMVADLHIAMQDVAAVLPGIAACMLRPSSHEPLHQTCRGRYRETVGRGHQYDSRGCEQVDQDLAICPGQLQCQQSQLEARREGLAVVVEER